jgi:hypothetical protein
MLVPILMAGGASTGTRLATSVSHGVDVGHFEIFLFASSLSTDSQGQRSAINIRVVVATTREPQARSLLLIQLQLATRSLSIC